MNFRAMLNDWEKTDNAGYAEAYNLFGGSFCSHYRLLDYLNRNHGIPVKYFLKRRGGELIAATFTIDGNLNYKNSSLPFVFDDIIIPIKRDEMIYHPFNTKRLSPYSHNSVINSFSHSMFKKKIAHIKSGFSKKTEKKRNAEIEKLISSCGEIIDSASIPAEKLAKVYKSLFLLRWKESIKSPSLYMLTEVITEFRDMIFGCVIYKDGVPCAFDLNYMVDCPQWLYIEDFNGGFDPRYKQLGLGSVLLWRNIKEARMLAQEKGKPLIFSLGAYNEAWAYKKQWCEINPSGRVIF